MQVEEWSKAGQVPKLEMVVMQGNGDLIGNISKMWNEEVRNFTKKVPALMVIRLTLVTCICNIQLPVFRNKSVRFTTMLQKEKWMFWQMCRHVKIITSAALNHLSRTPACYCLATQPACLLF